jgi:hypothetical protein
MAFEIWIAILKRRDFLEVTVINGTRILNCILKSSFGICGLHFLVLNEDQ